jgi:benzodiazapine receptor
MKMHRTFKQQTLGLIGWLAICFIAAAIGMIASLDAGNFYNNLQSPSWAPSANVFGPVWSILYALMGISAWLVWRRHSRAVNQPALTLFIVQLLVNATWSWMFFRFHTGLGSFINIVLLWILIVMTIVLFWKRSNTAGALLIPYFLWVTFATFLNYTMWQMNPDILG